MPGSLPAHEREGNVAIVINEMTVEPATPPSPAPAAQGARSLERPIPEAERAAEAQRALVHYLARLARVRAH